MPNNRDDLILLLTYAAELEHSLCCQYLFAAVSLKQDPSEGLTWEGASHNYDWAQQLFLIARMEMEHLALVCNILNSIGAAPHLTRPNFPQGPRYYPLSFSLEKFSEETIKRFICFERPDTIQPQDAFCCDETVEPLQPAPGGHNPASLEHLPSEIHFATVGELYEKISRCIQSLPIPDNDLFVGPPNAQIDGNILHLDFPRPGALGGVWDVTLFPITDRPTALRAIELILEEGEGTPGHNEHTHYKRFLQILQELQQAKQADPSFQPARNVVSNPLLTPHYDADRGALITHPDSKAVLKVFNEAYEVLLLLLLRFFGHGDETRDDFAALTFTLFPMMTMVIRPLSEILVMMPAYKSSSEERAGPSFELSRTVQLLPHKESAWTVLEERIQNLASECLAVSQRPGVPERLDYIARNLGLMASKFKMMADGTYPKGLNAQSLAPPGH